MAKRQLPSPEVLRQLLRYEPETGKLFWKERTIDHVVSDAQLRRWNALYANTEAFTADLSKDESYKVGRVFGAQVRAHRVAWAIAYGEWPKGMIDHIDGNPANNRIANLRVVNASINARNCKRSSSNKSGTTGVFRAAGRTRWTAVIYVNKRTIKLGRFQSYDDAVTARKKAEADLGFSPNHGREAIIR